MCDYSLELYRSRPADVGQKLDLHRFPSGTMGFTAGGDKETAACVLPGATLQLEKIDSRVQSTFNVGPTETVTMIRMDADQKSTHHDGVRFTNGREVKLQSLNDGMTARLLPVGATAVEAMKKAATTAEPIEQTIVAPARAPALVGGDD